MTSTYFPGVTCIRFGSVWPQRIAILSSFLVAVILLISSYAHILNGYQLLHNILGYRLVPTWAAIVIASVLPYLQLSIGVSIIFIPPLRNHSINISLILFTLYVIAQLSAYFRGLDIACGCFGDSGGKIGAKSISIAVSGLFLSFISFVGGVFGLNCRANLGARAKYGFTLLELLVVIGILTLLVGMILTAVQNVRATATRADCQHRMKQVAMALHQYHVTNRAFPPGISLKHDESKYPFLGWTARILPYLELAPIYEEIQSAFSSDPNPLVFYGHLPHEKLLATPIVAYACPDDSRTPGPAQIGPIRATFTSYLGVSGTNQYLRDGVHFLDSTVKISDIRDGTSQTLIVGERPPSADLRLGWWYRGWGQVKDGSAEMILGVRERNVTRPGCPTTGHQFSPGSIQNLCDLFHFWSLHSGGANFAFADGSVRFLRYSSNEILPALATRAGGESDAILE